MSDTTPAAVPPADRQRRGVLLLRDVARLRADLEVLIRDGRRQGDDIYSEQYNTLCEWSLAIFTGHPALVGKLVRMPDAQTKMFPNSGTERLLARLRYLESALANILGVDSQMLPGTRLNADAEKLTEIKSTRFRFLRHLWESTNGREGQVRDLYVLGTELGLPRDSAAAVAEYLEGEGLMRFVANPSAITITHRGVVEVEAAIEKPQEPTPHFPPLNIVYIAQMVNSQLQQGTTDSTQTRAQEQENEP